MTCRLIGRPIETAEMSATVPTLTQGVTPDAIEGNKALKAVIVALHIENPVMTALSMELWSGSATAPTKLIAASTNSKTLAQLLGNHPTDDYAFGWFYFNFANIPLRAGATYWIAMRCTGYTYSANQHIGWKHAYPDQPARSGVTLTAVKGAEHPLEVNFITAPL